MVNGYDPVANRHKIQAEHNFECIKQINKESFKDWFITISFYIALQYVDSHAKFRNINFNYIDTDEISPHIKRLKYVANNISNKFTIYKRLYEESRSARYDPLYFKFFKGDLDELLNSALSFREIVP